ncbi:MAG TPA: DNA translocase FtsK [Firmicutes bacterium]|nr:DNA translocase FtsK [Bacillota bacterium]
MGKKKKGKGQNEPNLSDITIELIGVSIVLLAIFILGQLGIIGTVLKRMIILIFGEFFWMVAIYLIFMGGKMIVSRSVPNFFSRRGVGYLLVFIALIVFSHWPVYHYFKLHDIALLGGMWDYYWSNNILSGQFTIGGGVIGSIIYGILVPLTSALGVYLLSLLSLIYGTLLIFNMTIKDLLEGTKYVFGQLKNNSIKAKKVRQERKVKKEKVEPIMSPQPTVDDVVEFEVISYEDEILNEKQDEVEPTNEIIEAVEQRTNEDAEYKIKDFIETINQAATSEENTIISPINESQYVLPPLELLEDYQQTNNSQRMLVSAKANARKLEDTFKNFDVKAKVQEVHIGPAVTRFEILPNVGVKVSKILSLTDDIALALAAKDIRIEAPIPGKSAIGIEVPNQKQSLVTFKEILKEVPAKHQQEKLLMVLGRDISGKTVHAPLNKMPHLLVAGATGSGKSVCINTIICSVLMRSTPNEVKMLMIDPKKVELNGYNGIPHLLAPVVTDARLASLALKKVVSEMEYRYELFSGSGTRNIEGYNDYVKQYNQENEDVKQQLPLIVVIIDELADLMMIASKDVEECIMRLTQMARAAGIHLIIATQRPSVDVITGVIKANIPSRIAFGVSSAVDSRTIIDMPGAEKLLGRGDMLFLPMGASNPTRVQGAFISDEEVFRMVDFIKSQFATEEIKQDFLENIEQTTSEGGALEDPLMKEVLMYIMETQKASASLLQRRFRIGYNRAARIIDDLETHGIIGPTEGSKPREVLMNDTQYQEIISNL